MIGLNSLTKLLTLNCENRSVQHQFVRFVRKPKKPFWLGIAKSKMFLLPKQPVYEPGEKEEIDRLEFLYQTQMRSLLHFLRNEDQKYAVNKSVEKFTISQEIIDKSLELNEKWNAGSAELRKKRLEKEMTEFEEQALAKIEEQEAKKRMISEKVAEILRIEKEKSKTYIKPENIDKAIQECLDKVVDYNFALDLNGNIYKGGEKIKNLTDELEVEKQRQ